MGIDRREEDSRDRSDSRDHEAADEEVATSPWQQHPGGACTEVRNGQDTARDVVRPKEAGAPASALGKGLAGRGHGEQREAERPQSLLSRHSAQQRASEQEGEGESQQRRRDRWHGMGDRRRKGVARREIGVTGSPGATTRR